MKIALIRTLVVQIVSCLAIFANLMANETTGTSLLNIAKAYTESASSGEPFICDYNGQNYVVSFGLANIENATPTKILNARLKAKLLAQKGLSKFVNDLSISSNEVLISKRKILILSKNGKPLLLEEFETNRYENVIREYGEGLLRSPIEVGTWMSYDNKLYYHAFAILLPSF